MKFKFAERNLKLVWDARFELATSHFQGEPSDLADNNPRLIWCPYTESNCKLRITKPPLYHLTIRAKLGGRKQNRTVTYF